MREARRSAPRLSPVTTLRILLMVWATLVAIPAIPNAVAAYQQTDQTLPTPKVLSAESSAAESAKPDSTEAINPVADKVPQVSAPSEITISSSKPSEPQVKPTDEAPYDLTTAGVAVDLVAVGFSLSDLNAAGVNVMGHSGPIPKRCSSGQAGTSYSQGLALKKAAVYKACSDGGQPIYEAYRPSGYSCSVIYNSSHAKKLAILAHEVAHCMYFAGGQYRQFDTDYKKLRDIEDFTAAKVSELVADDYMICVVGRDTGWGSGSYYARYGVDKLTSSQCIEFKRLVAANL